jgi:hypothetical protein
MKTKIHPPPPEKKKKTNNQQKSNKHFVQRGLMATK